MAFPHEHIASIRRAGNFDEFRRRNSFFDEGVHVVWGVDDGSSKIVSIRFSAATWSTDDAREWLDDNDFKAMQFDAATGSGNGAVAGVSFRVGRRKDVSSAVARLSGDGPGGLTITFDVGSVDKLKTALNDVEAWLADTHTPDLKASDIELVEDVSPIAVNVLVTRLNLLAEALRRRRVTISVDSQAFKWQPKPVDWESDHLSGRRPRHEQIVANAEPS